MQYRWIDSQEQLETLSRRGIIGRPGVRTLVLEINDITNPERRMILTRKPTFDKITFVGVPRYTEFLDERHLNMSTGELEGRISLYLRLMPRSEEFGRTLSQEEQEYFEEIRDNEWQPYSDNEEKDKEFRAALFKFKLSEKAHELVKSKFPLYVVLSKDMRQILQDGLNAFCNTRPVTDAPVLEES